MKANCARLSTTKRKQWIKSSRNRPTPTLNRSSSSSSFRSNKTSANRAFDLPICGVVTANSCDAVRCCLVWPATGHKAQKSSNCHRYSAIFWPEVNLQANEFEGRRRKWVQRFQSVATNRSPQDDNFFFGHLMSCFSLSLSLSLPWSSARLINHKQTWLENISL